MIQGMARPELGWRKLYLEWVNTGRIRPENIIGAAMARLSYDDGSISGNGAISTPALC